MTKPDPKVRNWATELLGSKAVISPLFGGANNCVFRCSGANNELVIKSYCDSGPKNGVSRLAAEAAFFRHAALHAANETPKLLGVNEVENMIAMSFVPGESICQIAHTSSSDILSLLGYYEKINQAGQPLSNYSIMARDGYLSISEHIANVELRLAALGVDHIPRGLRTLALSTLKNVSARFETATKIILRSIDSGAISDKLPMKYMQLSPGDFGFHNVIRHENGLVVIDFEYAGLDDPAKTVADFFLQPKVGIDRTFFDQVVSRMAIAIPPKTLRSRALVLGRLLSIKWLAIILGPLDRERYPSFISRHGSAAMPRLLERLQLAQKNSLFELKNGAN